MGSAGRKREDSRAEDFAITLRRAVEAAVEIDGVPRDRVIGWLSAEVTRNTLLLLPDPDNPDFPPPIRCE